MGMCTIGHHDWITVTEYDRDSDRDVAFVRCAQCGKSDWGFDEPDDWEDADPWSVL
jgi:hypothetical protein